MTVDLSSLRTAGKLQIPTIQGTCSDDDDGNPDNADPDCDEAPHNHDLALRRN